MQLLIIITNNYYNSINKLILQTLYCYSVEDVYQNQKKLEAESKQLQAHAGIFL
jgi:hypothetical protein